MKQNLAVGQNLQDHLIVPMVFKFNRPGVPAKVDNILQDATEFSLHNKGPFTNIGAVELVGVNKTGYPNIQFHYFSFNKQSYPLKTFLGVAGFGKIFQIC